MTQFTISTAAALMAATSAFAQVETRTVQFENEGAVLWDALLARRS